MNETTWITFTFINKIVLLVSFYIIKMPKSFSSIPARKIWPAERKLINRIITKQKGYHTKPYPDKNKIPSEALHSVQGALDVLDKAEKKKPNKGSILKFRRAYEHQQNLPTPHYFAFKKRTKRAPKPKKAPQPRRKMTEAEREAALIAKDPEYRPSSETLARRAETKEQRMARLQASLAAARKGDFTQTSASGNAKLAYHDVIGSRVPKDFFTRRS